MKYYELKKVEVHTSSSELCLVFYHADIRDQTLTMLIRLGRGKVTPEGALRHKISKHEILFLWSN